MSFYISRQNGLSSVLEVILHIMGYRNECGCLFVVKGTVLDVLEGVYRKYNALAHENTSAKYDIKRRLKHSEEWYDKGSGRTACQIVKREGDDWYINTDHTRFDAVYQHKSGQL